MEKYFAITYGCQMNRSDSERIATVLEKVGYKKASEMDEADLIMVNMCSVRQSAVDRVYGKIKDFAKLKVKNEKLKVILTGCVLKKDRKKFAEYFNHILDIRDLPNWPKYLKSQSNEVRPRWDYGEGARCADYLRIVPKYSSFSVGYVPISTGCNNFCTYCVVPHTRSREVCRPFNGIICEVKNLIKKGYKEIWLLGQNVNSYKSQIPKINFPKLLRMVNDIPGEFWIRFTSPHPKDFSDELIEAMAECEKLTPYLNLPVQSGDNKILRKMNRNYTVEGYKNLVKKIRKKILGVTLSTDVIVGFPGETERQFQNTVKLFKEIKFDMAYIARYSPRISTAAAKMEDDISPEERKKREKILTEVLEKTALAKNKKYIDKIVEVLSTEWRNDFLIGKSFHYKTVKLEGQKNLIGKFLKVKIIDATEWGLKGKLIKKVTS